MVECDDSAHPVVVREPHFDVFPEFKHASYLERGQILLSKLMRERHYDATCFLTTPPNSEDTGDYCEPDDELTFRYFAESLRAQATALQNARDE